jgi:hypothetical protein
MADEQDKPLDLTPFVFGPIDISEIEAPPEAWEPVGLKPLGPITFAVDFDCRPICPLCQIRFLPADNLPAPRASADGVDLGPICDACAISLLDP